VTSTKPSPLPAPPESHPAQDARPAPAPTHSTLVVKAPSQATVPRLQIWRPPASVVVLHRELFFLRPLGVPFESKAASCVWDDKDPPSGCSCAGSPDSSFRLLISTLQQAGDAAFLEEQGVQIVISVLDDEEAPGELLAAPVEASVVRGASSSSSSSAAECGSADVTERMGFESDLTTLRGRVQACGTVREHLCFDLRDTDDARGAMLRVFHEACKAIDRQRRSHSGAVLVHCRAGVSRSPSVVLAWLVRMGLLLEDAVALVRRARPQAMPNYGFFASLLRWSDVYSLSPNVHPLLTSPAAEKPVVMAEPLDGAVWEDDGDSTPSDGSMEDDEPRSGGFGAPHMVGEGGLGLEDSSLSRGATRRSTQPSKARVERPTSASVPLHMRYSDEAADRMARRVAERIGLALEPPEETGLQRRGPKEGAHRTSSASSDAGSFTPDSASSTPRRRVLLADGRPLVLDVEFG
jgi:hypothetical protein